MYNAITNQLMAIVRVGVIGMAGLTASACSCGSPVTSMSDAAPAEGGVSDAGPLMGPSADLIEAVCGKLSTCYPSMDLDACRMALAGEPGREIWDEFGAPENVYDAAELNAAVRGGGLLVNDANLSACVEAIGMLTCAELRGEPWSSTDPDNFDNVENMLDSAVVPDCVDVFSGG